MLQACPKITKSLLIKQYRQIGLASGDIVMIHASMRAVGEILGGPDILIEAILEAVGTSGTIMMYVGCQTPFDDIGRQIFSAEDEAFILEHCPPFISSTARANREFGVLAEFFRVYPGVKCSQNVVARMAAIGSRADWLLSPHDLNYGYGRNSPLERFCDSGGKVLLVGSDLDQVTLLHHAEAISPINQKKMVYIKVPLIRNHRRQWVDVEDFDSSVGMCNWPDRFFCTILEMFIDASKPMCGFIGNAQTYLLNANELVKFAIPIMVETAKTIDKTGQCS